MSCFTTRSTVLNRNFIFQWPFNFPINTKLATKYSNIFAPGTTKRIAKMNIHATENFESQFTYYNIKRLNIFGKFI